MQLMACVTLRTIRLTSIITACEVLLHLRVAKEEPLCPTDSPKDLSYSVAGKVTKEQAFGSAGHHKAILVDVNFGDGLP